MNWISLIYYQFIDNFGTICLRFFLFGIVFISLKLQFSTRFFCLSTIAKTQQLSFVQIIKYDINITVSDYFNNYVPNYMKNPNLYNATL